MNGINTNNSLSSGEGDRGYIIEYISDLKDKGRIIEKRK